jgi:hypothetical protein
LSTSPRPPPGEIVGELDLDRDNLAGVDVVLLGELDHAMDGRLSVARF